MISTPRSTHRTAAVGKRPPGEREPIPCVLRPKTFREKARVVSTAGVDAEDANVPVISNGQALCSSQHVEALSEVPLELRASARKTELGEVTRTERRSRRRSQEGKNDGEETAA